MRRLSSAALPWLLVYALDHQSGAWGGHRKSIASVEGEIQGVGVWNRLLLHESKASRFFCAHETPCLNAMEQRRKLQKMCLSYCLCAIVLAQTLFKTYPNIAPLPNPTAVEKSQHSFPQKNPTTFSSILTCFIQIWTKPTQFFIQVVEPIIILLILLHTFGGIQYL